MAVRVLFHRLDCRCSQACITGYSTGERSSRVQCRRCRVSTTDYDLYTLEGRPNQCFQERSGAAYMTRARPLQPGSQGQWICDTDANLRQPLRRLPANARLALLHICQCGCNGCVETEPLRFGLVNAAAGR